MIQIQLTITKAIALHRLLFDIECLTSPAMPDAIKLALLQNSAGVPALQEIYVELALKLSDLKQQQEVAAGYQVTEV